MSANPEVPDGKDVGSPTARREAWSQYWARGASHSCVGTYGETYGGAIAEFWREVFGSLPATARVLDIATGNGALPRLLLDRCRGPGVQCDAVDIAALSPAWLMALSPAERERLRFHGGLDAAELPFADRQFDLIVSQYGLEYTDLARTVPELLRVLAPGGGIALMVHHAQGRPATLAALELDHLGWLSRDGGFLEATAAMIEPMARAATPKGRESLMRDPKANAIRDRFNALQDELAARGAGGDGADVLFDVREAAMGILALAGREGAAKAHAALASLRGDYRASATRLDDLCAHALGTEAAQALRDLLAASLALPASLGELRERGHLMGWTLTVLPEAAKAP